jgi:hypothetical protein
MRGAGAIDERGTLCVDSGAFVKPESWARQLTDWLATLLATELELFQLRTSPLGTDQFAVAAVKERRADAATIRVGTGRGPDAVKAVTTAVTAAACGDDDVLETALERLMGAGLINAAALARDGVHGTHFDDRLSRLLEVFDEPGLLEVRTDGGEYGALRLGASGIALAVGMPEPSSRVHRWLNAVWEGVGEPPNITEERDDRL